MHVAALRRTARQAVSAATSAIAGKPAAQQTLRVLVLERREDLGENLRLDHDLGQVDRVLGDLRQTREHLSLQLGVGVRDEGRQVGHGAIVHHDLG
jgi:hypothetical protein